MPKTEIHDLDTLRRRLLSKQGLTRVVVQGLDLTPVEDTLRGAKIHDTVFLGCHMSDPIMAFLVRRGAVIFPDLHGLPYKPYRNHLYNVHDLFDGFDIFNPCTYCQTTDARIYHHWRKTGRSEPRDIMETLARRLHDLSISEAVSRLLEDTEPENVIAIMGGHSVGRDSPEYAMVAQISRTLTRCGKIMLSGGGPGAMEATHVGASFANRADSELDKAIQILATAPIYNNQYWLSRAFEVIDNFKLHERPVSLGIPTWHYGHEPPSPFASHIAKYFSNATREEGLITLAIGGLIVAPGSAGTIQEVFQDAAQNHYKTTGWISPIIFLDKDYWTYQKAAYPLLDHIARDQDYGRLIGIGDTAQQVLDFLERHPPQKAARQEFSYCDLFC